MTRRDFGKLTTAGVVLSRAAARSLTYKGVRLGVGSYSFRGLHLDEVITFVAATEVGGMELESPFVEPALPREAVRQWRLTVPLDEFKTLRQKMHKAGISVYAYSVPVDESFTDAEIDRVLLMTSALGSPVFNTSADLTVARRLAPLAEKHGLIIGLHPSGNPSYPDRVGSGASYLKAFEISPRIYANLDLYLYREWGPDPIAFLKQIHSRVTTIHIHDRKLSETPQAWVPFGEGDMPVKELLLLAKKEKYRFTFSIERIYAFPGFDRLAEMRKSIDYCRRVLD